MIIQVAVPGPFLTPLDYLYDLTEGPKPVLGGRVRIPFRNKERIGLVMNLPEQSDYDPKKIKTVIDVLDAEPLFNQTHLKFIEWAAQYYHEPIGEVVQAALPKKLRAGEAVEVEGLPAWKLSASGKKVTPNDLPKNAKHQIALYNLLKQASEPLSVSQLNGQLESWRASLKKFIEAGWIDEHRGLCLADTYLGEAPNHTLNDEQQHAVDAVASLPDKTFKAFLVEGVTGSGKTEVYLGMIEQAIKQGKQALVLVPEIGLTPQMVSRFNAFLQKPIATLHSGMNDSERLCAWHLVRTGQVSVLLGTRSAIFAPFKNLGLCIIDEEHDLSFKQQEGFRYSARDLMIRRAFDLKIPVVLGSATPSLETLHNAKAGRYGYLQLKLRAANAQMPSIKLLDIRGEKVQEGVTAPLKNAMQKHLEAGGQVLLFLNRRGFAPVLMCHDCGWQAQCPSCDANMTLHQAAFPSSADTLRCHHCGHQAFAPQACPSCECTEFVKIGQGTERLTETVTEWFPKHRVVRIDRDTTRLKGKMKELTDLARSGEADILIGTQMLAKGHHFPNVTLVGLIDIDQGLFGADFRAPERMAQLVLQVAGRAGRGEKAGEVLIQTHHPDHPMLRTLVSQGYDQFAIEALKERKLASLPPFKYQIMLRAEAHLAQDARHFLSELKQALLQMQSEQGADSNGLEIWGPVSAPMERRQGRYRYQLLIQSAQRSQLHKLWNQVEPYVYSSPLARKVRWSIDVDPQEMN
ncbi:MAG: primosomal protein N' [Thiotrichales bacterium]|nr:primosomal protein N' [Thiotrichales bacterium]